MSAATKTLAVPQTGLGGITGVIGQAVSDATGATTSTIGNIVNPGNAITAGVNAALKPVEDWAVSNIVKGMLWAALILTGVGLIIFGTYRLAAGSEAQDG